MSVSLQPSANIPGILHEEIINVLMFESARVIAERGIDKGIPDKLMSYGFVNILAKVSSEGLGTPLCLPKMRKLKRNVLSRIIEDIIAKPRPGHTEELRVVKLSNIVKSYKDCVCVGMCLTTSTRVGNYFSKYGVRKKKKKKKIKKAINRINKVTAETEKLVDGVVSSGGDHIKKIKKITSETAYATNTSSGNNGDGFSGLEVAGIVVGVAALAYGGYKLYESFESEDTIDIDLSECY